MRRSLVPLQAAALALACAAVPAALPAAAQVRPAFCPEGRLMDGTCVNPRLAFAARQQGICYTQAKLSYIACPGVLPGLDTRYTFPFNVILERQRELNLILER